MAVNLLGGTKKDPGAGGRDARLTLVFLGAVVWVFLMTASARTTVWAGV